MEKFASPNQEFTRLFIKVGRIQFLVLGLIISGFVFFGRYFITNIYAGKSYADAYAVALWLVLPMVVPLIQNLGLDIQRALNKHKFRSIVCFAMSVVNIVISIPLAMRYGPIGSAAGTGIGLILVNGFVMNIYYKKVIKIDISSFWKNILSLLKGLMFPLLIGRIVSVHINICSNLMFVILICVYTLIYAIFAYKFSMNLEEKFLIKELVCNPNKPQ